MTEEYWNELFSQNWGSQEMRTWLRDWSQSTPDYRSFVRNLLRRINIAEREYQGVRNPFVFAPQGQKLERMIRWYFETLALWPYL
jgi:hypothetical protein